MSDDFRVCSNLPMTESDVNVPIPITQYIQLGISISRKNRLNGCFRIWPKHHNAESGKGENKLNFFHAREYQKNMNKLLKKVGYLRRAQKLFEEGQTLFEEGPEINRRLRKSV